MPAWHEDESFWLETETVLFSKERWEKAPEEVEQVLKLVDLPVGASVLDLGCGPGRHALVFARRGLAVTGVDRTRRYLDQAEARARQEGLDAEWVLADMRAFRREDAFDLAVNLLTTFGYFEDPADDRRVAEHIFASLKPGGHAVFELMGKEVLARIFQKRDWNETEDGVLFLEDRKIADDWSRLDMRWIIIQEGQRREQHFTLRPYSASELKGLLNSVGFARTSAFGSLGGAPYGNEAERLVVVAQKPA